MKRKKHPELGDIDVKDFRGIWNRYIIPKKGKTIPNARGGEYLIIDVDENRIVRHTSSNNGSREITFLKCQQAYHALLEKGGYITREELVSIIGQWWPSFIVSLFATELPHIEATSNPRGIKLK